MRIVRALEFLDFGNHTLRKPNDLHGGSFYTVCKNGTSFENDQIENLFKLKIINDIYKIRDGIWNVPFVSLLVVGKRYTTTCCVYR